VTIFFLSIFRAEEQQWNNKYIDMYITVMSFTSYLNLYSSLLNV